MAPSSSLSSVDVLHRHAEERLERLQVEESKTTWH
jgi:hypothetical protein